MTGPGPDGYTVTRLEAAGIDVVGVTDHGLFHSIYFFDPNGHRLELTYNDDDAEAKEDEDDDPSDGRRAEALAAADDDRG